LIKQNETDFANQVNNLEIVDRCSCNDDFCATFYTVPKPKESWGENHYNIELEPEIGTIVLDIKNEEIVSVEILYRDEIRTKLNAIFPKKA